MSVGRVWALAWPAIVSSLSVPLLGAVDTAVVGHLPAPAYLGGVAIGALIFDFVYWGFGFLRMGTTGFAAQALGAGDADELRASLVRPLLIAAVLGGVIWALQVPIREAAFALVDASAAVEVQGRNYFDVRVWAAPAVLANYALLGFLLGVQRPRLALVTQLAANGTNIVLDWVLAWKLGMGVAGVAAATVCAQLVALGVGWWAVRQVLAERSGRVHRAALFDRAKLMQLVRVNGDIFLRTVCLIGAFAWFTAQGARMGEVVLAANAVLLNLQTIMAYGLDGFAHAAEALVGEHLGARDPAGLRRSVRVTTGMAAGVALGFTLAWALGGELVVAALTNLPEVRATAAIYLPWLVATPFISVWCFQLDGVFIGATRTGAMRNAMLISLAAFLAVGSLALERWGNHGLWGALTFFFAVRGVTLWVAYPGVIRSAQSSSPSSA